MTAKQYTTTRIRKLLREHTDGMTVKEVAAALKVNEGAARTALNRLPDAYRDRWCYDPATKRDSAVYCVVIPPPDCPKPEPRHRRKPKKASTG